MNPERLDSTKGNHNEEESIGKEWQEMDAKTSSNAEPNDGERRESSGEVKVRLLNPETDDLSRAASLLFQVDPYICPDFFGDAERAKKIGGVLFGEEDGLFVPRHILVAELD